MKRKAKYCGRGRGILCTASIAIPWLKETGGDSNPYCKRSEHIFLRVTTCTLSEKHPEPRAERLAPRIGVLRATAATVEGCSGCERAGGLRPCPCLTRGLCHGKCALGWPAWAVHLGAAVR